MPGGAAMITIAVVAVLAIVIFVVDPGKLIEDLYTRSKNGGVLLEWDAGATDGAPSDIEALLRSYGVKVYARQYPRKHGGVAGCHVRRAQAKYADGILRGHGVPVLSKQLSKPIRPRRRWGVMAKSQGFAGWMNDALFGGEDEVRRLFGKEGKR